MHLLVLLLHEKKKKKPSTVCFSYEEFRVSTKKSVLHGNGHDHVNMFEKNLLASTI